MIAKVKTLEEVKEKNKSNQPRIFGFGVQTIAVFGSFSRNEMVETSDVDILVEFSRPIGLFEFARLKIFLSEILGREVDLVTVDALHQRMKSSILKEAVNVTTGLAH